jgi:uncharacterized phiE125 gp8 family phage protein
MLTLDPIAPPMSAVQECAQFLRIDIPDDDALLSALLAAAARRTEDFCGQVLLTRMAVETQLIFTHQGFSLLDEVPQWRFLKPSPVQFMTSITTQATSPVALDATAISTSIDTQGRCAWRLIDTSLSGTLSFTMQAGAYAHWDVLPEAMRLGIMRLAAYYYTSRDNANDAGPPAAVAALLRPYRRTRLI